MALVKLKIPIEDVALPDSIQSLIDEANGRIDHFLSGHRDDPVPGFFASDFPLVYRALRTMLDIQLPTGPKFCEWGSGFGVVAVIAAMLGLDACGIEIDGELVHQSRQLASDFEVQTPFVRGSFLPDNFDVNNYDRLRWLVTDVAPAYEQLAVQLHEFDVIFAYPWPGEEAVIDDVFDQAAGVGAILMTFHGTGDLRIHRKRAAAGEWP